MNSETAIHFIYVAEGRNKAPRSPFGKIEVYMFLIEGFRIKNFRSLRDVEFGKLRDTQQVLLTPHTAVIGKNGVGKSSLFDAFGFLADCLHHGVEEACDMAGRGGFKKIKSMNTNDPITIELSYKESEQSESITYKIMIDIDESNRAYVKGEWLFQYREIQNYEDPLYFLAIELGKGYVWTGNSSNLKQKEYVELNDIRKLGIATFGALKEYPQISAFTQFIEGWYLSYFSPDEARGLPLTGPQKHLNRRGDNLANVVQYLEREAPEKLKAILDNISKKIPGIQNIKTERSPDDRILLCFNDKGFADPFYAQQMSDGTLKLFSYLLLLADPNPPPFICIEEPENGLYHKLLEILASELRNHATGIKGGSGGSQVFITTHQPYFINAMKPEEVWILEKQDDGFSTISRASDNDLIRELAAEELPLGSLWYSDYFDKRM
jgi:predicted ATPase